MPSEGSTYNAIYLTLLCRMPLPYRNQSTDFQSKSVDWLLYDRDFRHKRIKDQAQSVYLPPPPTMQGAGGWASNQIFRKRRGLDRASTFRGGLLGKRWATFSGGGELQFSHKNKLKSEIFNNKKSLYAKILFSVKTKNSSRKILPKNLVTFKR